MNQEAVNFRIDRFDVDAVVRNWSWAGVLLAPSVRIAGRRIEDVKTSLIMGDMGMASVHAANGAGLIVVQPGNFGGVFACWIAYVAIRIKAGPKAWVRIVHEGVRYFEDRAREAGCTEMRIGGREFWAVILPDYEPFELGWKKAL